MIAIQILTLLQSDRLIFKYVMSAWLQFVYVSKRTFSSSLLLLEFSLPSISSFSSLTMFVNKLLKNVRRLNGYFSETLLQNMHLLLSN